jgi:hypothetical protein
MQKIRGRCTILPLESMLIYIFDAFLMILYQVFLLKINKLRMLFKLPFLSGLNGSDKVFKFTNQHFLTELPYKLKHHHFENVHGFMSQILFLCGKEDLAKLNGIKPLSMNSKIFYTRERILVFKILIFLSIF